jgi:hypothetical protein
VTETQPNLELRELDSFADGIVRRGLTVPAIFLLELHKPLTGIGHLVAEAFDPLTRCLLGSERAATVLKLLESRAHVEYVLTRLEMTARSNPHGG